MWLDMWLSLFHACVGRDTSSVWYASAGASDGSEEALGDPGHETSVKVIAIKQMSSPTSLLCMRERAALPTADERRLAILKKEIGMEWDKVSHVQHKSAGDVFGCARFWLCPVMLSAVADFVTGSEKPRHDLLVIRAVRSSIVPTDCR
jgi:hypothetical protein